MGIRFRCHHCGREMHVKDFQAGKRSRCPFCEGKFRIPPTDAEFSVSLDGNSDSSATASSAAVAVASPARAGSTKTDTSIVAAAKPPAPTSEISSANSPSAPLPLPSAGNSSRDTKPHALLEVPAAIWYVRPPSGGQFGPAPVDVFFDWMRENRVTRDSLVWRDGWPQWLVALEVFADFFGAQAAPATSSMTAASAEVPKAPVSSSKPVPSSKPVDPSPAAAISELANRKIKRKRRYMMLIALLTTLAVALMLVLVFVIMQQSS